MTVRSARPGTNHGQEAQAEAAGRRWARSSQHHADAQGVRTGTLSPAGRADAAAGLDGGQGRASDRGVRGARHGGQGRGDQADHRALQPPRVPPCGPADAVRPGEEPALHPALHGPLPRRRRDHPVPDRSWYIRAGVRAGDWVLHRRPVSALPQTRPGCRARDSEQRDHPAEVLPGRQPGRAAAAVRGPKSRTRSSTGS